MPDRPDQPTFSPDQLDRLARVGTERAVEAGEILFREGDPGYDFFVVLDGAVAVYADPDCERAITSEPLGPGRMLGEMGLLLGESVFATARVEAPGRVLQVPAEAFRDLLARDTDLAETILSAFAARRGKVAEGASGLTLVGAQTDPEAVRLAEFARRNYLPLRWLTPDDAETAEVLARAGRDAAPEGPVVVWGTETVLDAPSNLELAQAVGIVGEMPESETADLVVIGAGPAGLAAAVYGASEGLRTVVVDEVGPGGQASWSSRIENYLGFPAGISGTDLATRATVQARKFGACLATPRRATGLGRDGDAYTVALGSGPTLRGRTVLIATGAHYNRLPLPNLRRFEGAGIYYAATEMEARGCDQRTVVVVGGGNSAGQAAMFLSERASVLLAVRGDDLRASMSSYLADRIEASDAIDLRMQTEVTALHGDGSDHEALAAVDVTTGGETERVETPGLFVFIGASPCTDWLQGDGEDRLGVALDAKGFVLAGADVPPECLPETWGDARPSTFETSLRGVFAVGDVRSGSTKRVAGAVGEGSVAVKAVHTRLAAPRPEPG
ncbi:FAD-dependent oxidoreductase [Rubrivirga sp. IMCC45206]|uniref:FAD-dependent oxidoreductase n=1 Tax=Rubrivirga sp. IMCC45206 TaxID=3391614 RepID=UPI00398FE259